MGGKRRGDGGASSLGMTKLKRAVSGEITVAGQVNWEQAVDAARGQPDGARHTASGKQCITHDPHTTSGKHTQQQQHSSAKIKPLKMLQTAAGKLKKFAGQKEEPRSKAVKRKHDSTTQGDGGAEGKRTKLDDLGTKERRKQRRMQKDNYDISSHAKSLWEKLRRADMTGEQRQRLATELFQLVQGNARQLIFAHDTSRVIQCLMKYGLQEHRNALFEELREHIVEMTKSKYAKFFVRKLLKYGTKAQRNYVFRSFYGNVRKLIRHGEAAELVELAYNDYANASQRAALIQEFYGPTYALFKTEEVCSLEQIMTEKRDSILSNMREVLAASVDKAVCQYSIIHKVFRDYFTYATEKYRTEMIETVRESLMHMLHTRDGAHVAITCLWHGTAKDRKVIIKSLKPYVLKICAEDYGHLVLLALFDVVDDTKLVSKAIMQLITSNLPELLSHQYGRKVVLYLLAPRHPLHFHPDIVSLLQKGDNNSTSKKASSVRRQELLEAISPSLLQYLCEHARQVVLSNAMLLLLLAILTHATGDLKAAMQAVCEIAAEPFVAGSLDSFHIVEHPVGHLTLKKLILNDKHRIKDKQPVLFSSVLLSVVPGAELASWAACNRGCFILASLLELDHSHITSTVHAHLHTITPALAKMDFKGAQLLLSKLSGTQS